MNSIKLLISLLFIWSATTVFGQEAMPEIIQVGDIAPEFDISTIDGVLIQSKNFKGKVVYLNFFATWCGPCMKEIPYVEEEIWKTIKSDDFIMLAIAREHSTAEIKAFKQKRNLTLPLAADSSRAVYRKFAPQMIPRNIVIDKEGKIAYSKHGFDQAEFTAMIKLIESLLQE